MLPMLHTIKKQHRRQNMNLSMAVIISHHTVYFPNMISTYDYAEIKEIISATEEKENSDFKYLTRKLCTDTEIGFFTADNIAGRTRKYRYNYKAFYAAAGNSTFDIFKCSENGKLYVPGAFELFCYMEDN